MTKVIKFQCPEYQFDNLNVDAVGKCIDAQLVENFADMNIVLRGIQSEKHDLPKEELVKYILDTGTDYYQSDSDNAVKVSDKKIDMFGLKCKVIAPIALPTLQGFHIFKPKCLEKPQRKIDIWMVYDAAQLENVEYMHSHYNVIAHDGYVFKDQNDKQSALIGLLIIE